MIKLIVPLIWYAEKRTIAYVMHRSMQKNLLHILSAYVQCFCNNVLYSQMNYIYRLHQISRYITYIAMIITLGRCYVYCIISSCIPCYTHIRNIRIALSLSLFLTRHNDKLAIQRKSLNRDTDTICNAQCVRLQRFMWY